MDVVENERSILVTETKKSDTVVLTPEEYLKELEVLIGKTNKVLKAEVKFDTELVELKDQFERVFLAYPHLAISDSKRSYIEWEFLGAYRCFKNLVEVQDQEQSQVHIQVPKKNIVEGERSLFGNLALCVLLVGATATILPMAFAAAAYYFPIDQDKKDKNKGQLGFFKDSFETFKDSCGVIKDSCVKLLSA